MELSDPFVGTAKASLVLVGNVSKLPSKNQAQFTLSTAITAATTECIADFALFTNRGFTISGKVTPTTRVELSDSGANVYYTYPFTIQQGKLRKSYQNFAQNVPVRLADMLHTAQTITSFAKERQEDADLSALLGSDLETLFFIADNSTVVVLRDLDHPVDGAPYEFWFGMR